MVAVHEVDEHADELGHEQIKKHKDAGHEGAPDNVPLVGEQQIAEQEVRPLAEFIIDFVEQVKSRRSEHVCWVRAWVLGSAVVIIW